MFISLFADFRECIVAFSTNLNVNIPDVKDLLAAFTHESYLITNADKLTEPHECNEKLAFLGKALSWQMNLIVHNIIYFFPLSEIVSL